ncbi:hypothetical protein CRENBAI_025875 [Crenichthys baileyi]|uniref:Uncharacterized protein n=1 Tax=Crenichthys baileyi TaxID=28760 RepID=A0AAV9S9H4_9TELE
MPDMDFTDNHAVLPVESQKTPPMSTSLGSRDSSGTGTVRRVPPPTPGAAFWMMVDFSGYFRLSRTQFKDLLPLPRWETTSGLRDTTIPGDHIEPSPKPDTGTLKSPRSQRIQPTA